MASANSPSEKPTTMKPTLGLTGLTINVGGSFVTINPGGVFISGPMVMINSGGMAGSGAGASPSPPDHPTDPDTADDGSKGTKL